ncbi:MAG: cytochrome d ubiquinol oxidase subunit II [Frankia sp.]
MATFWFIVLAILWSGFMVLEGFDFGVGVLHRWVGRDDESRRALIATIGPVWDGNEVWLITAAAATFAAFPGWYATMFSGYYLALVLLLVALILRGVAIEFRGRRDSARWRNRWSAVLAGSSIVAPLVVGVALADLLYGLPIDANQEFTGSFFTLFNGYSVLTGVTFAAISLLHGAAFLMMKTDRELHDRSARVARSLAPVAVVAVFATVIWTHVLGDHGFLLNVVELTALVAALAAWWLVREGRPGGAFTATTVTIAGVVLALFTNLYPRVMVSSLGARFDLTIHNTASAPYALKVMTVIVSIFLPGVLIYQGWAYHVFRKRVAGPIAHVETGEPEGTNSLSGASPARRPS